MKGICIDQAWIRIVSNKVSLINHSIKTYVYSDHEKVKIELKIQQPNLCSNNIVQFKDILFKNNVYRFV